MKRLFPVILLLLFFAFVKAASPFQFVSPLPGSKLVNVEHNIVLRPGSPLDASTIQKSFLSIEGTKSGKHDFIIKLSADGSTINLDPYVVFAFDEIVTVSTSSGLKTADGKEIEPFQFTFITHREYSVAEMEAFKKAPVALQEKELKLWNVSSASEGETRDVEGMLDIPINDNPAPGNIFFDAFSGWGLASKYTGYTMINSNGDSLFQRTLGFADDFKLQHNGMFAVYNGDLGRFDVLDSNFSMIGKYYGVNGYYTDNHELQLLADGHALLIAQEFQTVDMTVYNPNYSPNATVFGGVIQEFDEDKILVFEWRAFDHIAVTEALHEDLSYTFIDYTHTNAIEIDNDGTILASHRHLDQITKIDRHTGEFIWRLGGVNNQFTFTNDPDQFTYQHDIRRIANGNITLFDNGNWHIIPHSTAKEYQLDEVNKTATLVWSYSHSDGFGGKILYFAMGSVQRLSNGSTFINWGWRGSVADPSMTEVTSDGEIAWELHLTSAKNMVAYRAHKYDYNACARPTSRKLHSVNVTPTMGTLKWSPAWGAVKYAVEFSKQGSGYWTQKTVDASKTTKTLINLTPNTLYMWRLQTWCDEDGNTVSGFTEVKKFQTPPLKMLTKPSENNIMIYPNPAFDQVSIHSNNFILREIVLRNMTGQEIKRIHAAENTQEEIQLPLSEVSAGSYLIELTSDNMTEVRKLIIQ